MNGFNFDQPGRGSGGYCQFCYLVVDKLKTAPLEDKALELGFHCFPWL